MNQTFGGRYRVLRRLGSGGMATVYLADDPLLGRRVAVKVPRLDGDGGDGDMLRRFKTELRAAGRLNHPNIVTIYDGGEVDGTPFLVMEPVEGESLAQLIRREAPLAPTRAIDIACQLASALAYAHREGVVHRDVKPQNVLLDAAGRVKVTDFGIATSTDVTRTLTGTILGTPSYLAPEVSSGGPITVAADIYGLGVVLFQMLTAHVPFEADNPIASAVRSQREDPPAPSTLAPLPRWLDAVVLRAIARDPRNRYASASELAADLERGLAGHGSFPGGRGEGRLDHGHTERVPAAIAAAPRAAQPGTARRGRRLRWLWLLPPVALAGAGVVFAWPLLDSAWNPATARPPAPASRAAPPGGNLLSNGGLVTSGPQPAGWRLQVFAGREPVRHWMPGGPAATDREITLESASGTDSAWISGDVTIAAGWKLTLTGFIQARDVTSDGAGAALGIVCHKAGGAEIGRAFSPPLSGSTGWQPVQAQMTAPPGVESCNAELRLGEPRKLARGVAAFSRISLAAT